MALSEQLTELGACHQMVTGKEMATEKNGDGKELFPGKA